MISISKSQQIFEFTNFVFKSRFKKSRWWMLEFEKRVIYPGWKRDSFFTRVIITMTLKVSKKRKKNTGNEKWPSLLLRCGGQIARWHDCFTRQFNPSRYSLPPSRSFPFVYLRLSIELVKPTSAGSYPLKRKWGKSRWGLEISALNDFIRVARFNEHFTSFIIGPRNIILL